MATRISEIRAKIRERIEELRKRILGGETVLRSSGQVVGPKGVIGGGKVISAVTSAIDEYIALVKERKPNIIPTILERISKLEPGKRIKELMPTTTTQPAVATEEKKKVLRG